MDNSIKSVNRAIDILYSLAESDKCLMEISRDVKLSKSTVHRQLGTLLNRNMVFRNPANDKYSLGPGFFKFLYRFIQSPTALMVAAQDSLNALNKLSGETVVLHTQIGDQRLCVTEVESKHELKYTSGIGSTAPMNAGAASKVFLSCMEEEDRRNFISQMKLESITENTISDPVELLKEVEKVAKDGYSISYGERIAGAASISVPIKNKDGRAIAVLSILGPGFVWMKINLDLLFLIY
ncbi:MAG: IclR family transcriptional regulator [Syntrophomonadaceae bacterium]|jgi:DNA-binding IclR family transcriptional regulator